MEYQVAGPGGSASVTRWIYSRDAPATRVNFEGFEEKVANREVAHEILQLRQDAGLSQVELARRVGTTQSVISRLEDADYEGHSLALIPSAGGSALAADGSAASPVRSSLFRDTTPR